jgi:hypothetical protein
MRYLITFDSWYRVLSKVVGLPPSSSYVDVEGEQIEVRMGWAFRSRFARSAVSSVSEPGIRPLSRGVHGFGGRWLVNGAERGIVSMELTPPQRAYVMGFPVKLKQLMVSVASPTAFAESLGHRLQVRRE